MLSFLSLCFLFPFVYQPFKQFKSLKGKKEIESHFPPGSTTFILPWSKKRNLLWAYEFSDWKKSEHNKRLELLGTGQFPEAKISQLWFYWAAPVNEWASLWKMQSKTFLQKPVHTQQKLIPSGWINACPTPYHISLPNQQPSAKNQLGWYTLQCRQKFAER